MRQSSIDKFASTAPPRLRIAEPELTKPLSDDALEAHIRATTEFCLKARVEAAENIEQIALANLRENVALPVPAPMAAPLHRKGFTEDERVAAYIGQFSRERTRISLDDALPAAGDA